MAHVFDQWTRENAGTRRRLRTERWGRGKRWLARWEDGESRRSRAFSTQVEAEDFLAKIRTGTIKASRPDGAPLLKDWLTVWRTAQVHHRDSTDRATSLYVARVAAALGECRIDELTRADIQGMIAGWGDTYSPATIRSTYTALTGAMKLAVLDGIIDSSPCLGVRLPKIERDRIVPLTVDQVRTIAARVPAHYQAMVWVAAASGMRGGELRGLTKDRISGTVLSVDRQLSDRVDGEPVFGPPKSKSGIRKVDIGKTAMAALEEHMRLRLPGSHGLVFTGRTGAPLTRTDMSEVWRNAVVGLGLRPRSGWHELRHYHASLLIAAGLSVTAVAERLGHKDATETLQTYAHLWPSDQSRAVAAVEENLRPVCDLVATSNAA